MFWSSSRVLIGLGIKIPSLILDYLKANNETINDSIKDNIISHSSNHYYHYATYFCDIDYYNASNIIGDLEKEFIDFIECLEVEIKEVHEDLCKKLEKIGYEYIEEENKEEYII